MDGFFLDPTGDDKATQIGPTIYQVNGVRENLRLPQKYICGNFNSTLYFEVDGIKKQIKYEAISVPTADYNKTKLVSYNN